MCVGLQTLLVSVRPVSVGASGDHRLLRPSTSTRWVLPTSVDRFLASASRRKVAITSSRRRCFTCPISEDHHTDETHCDAANHAHALRSRTCPLCRTSYQEAKRVHASTSLARLLTSGGTSSSILYAAWVLSLFE